VITEYLAIIISRKALTNSSLLRCNATQDFGNRLSMSPVLTGLLQALQKEKEKKHMIKASATRANCHAFFRSANGEGTRRDLPAWNRRFEPLVIELFLPRKRITVDGAVVGNSDSVFMPPARATIASVASAKNPFRRGRRVEQKTGRYRATLVVNVLWYWFIAKGNTKESLDECEQSSRSLSLNNPVV